VDKCIQDVLIAELGGYIDMWKRFLSRLWRLYWTHAHSHKLLTYQNVWKKVRSVVSGGIDLYNSFPLIGVAMAIR
jgi:hypothetical protein